MTSTIHLDQSALVELTNPRLFPTMSSSDKFSLFSDGALAGLTLKPEPGEVASAPSVTPGLLGARTAVGVSHLRQQILALQDGN